MHCRGRRAIHPGRSSPDMPRVVFVLGETASGGAENQCRYLLEALRGRGLELELVYFRRGRQHERFEALGIPLHEVPARARLALDLHRRARYLRPLVRARDPDILHTWMYEAHQVALLAAGSRPRARMLLSHRSSGMVPGERRQIAALRLLRRRVDHIVANSGLGAEFIADRVGIPADRVSVIPNGIPADRVAVGRDRQAMRRELGIADDVPVVCSVGVIDRRGKDHSTVVAAMAEVWSALPRAELLMVGPPADQVERLLGTPLPPRVRALGWHPRPADLMNAADVVAVHSRTEGHSNVAGEGLMLGLPVATTDTGGHPPLVRNAGGRGGPLRRGALLC